ncbi:MAG: dethiobiotin synthase [Vicinamibacterales bacterium]
MSTGIFITGSDTGVGKTHVATALLRGLVVDGFRAVGMKPVATGIGPAEARNADVLALAASGNVDALPDDINPFAFAPAIAPHLAAEEARVAIDLDRIASAYDRLSARADFVVVEGAGGALTPLSARTDMLDIAARLGLPVLLVVGIRLGCINHALLTALAIDARGLHLAGWIANRIDPAMLVSDANVDALACRIPAPLVADLTWQGPNDTALAMRSPVRTALGLSR